MDAACCRCSILIVIVIAVMLSVSIAMPILPCLFLPTEERPRIVLQGDHGLYRADARVGEMAPAPVLHYATRMLARLIFVLFLAVGSQAKKAKQAKCAQSKTEGEEIFLHDISPIDSVQNSANSHPTRGILSNRVLKLFPYIGTGFVECNNYIYNTMEFPIGY